jgi:hypothetical protein
MSQNRAPARLRATGRRLTRWPWTPRKAVTALYAHAHLTLEPSIAILRKAARDGEATTPDGHLVVCNDANEADPRFSIREPGGTWKHDNG